MTTINQPRTSVAIVNASQKVANTGQRVLLVAQQSAAATATPGLLHQQIANDLSFVSLFGANSQMTNMIRAFKRSNEATRVDVISLADGGAAVAVEYTFTFVGTATEDGSFDVVAGSARDFTANAAITSGDDATVAATALTASLAVFAAANFWPFTVSSTLGVVTIVAVNAGTLYNDIGIRITGAVAGLTLVAAQSVAGTIPPTLTGVLDPINGERYQGILWPFQDTTELTTVLGPRFNNTGNVLDGVGFVPFVGTVAGVTAQIDENSPSVVYFVQNLDPSATQLGGQGLEFGFNQATYFAAIRAIRMDSSAQNISAFVNAAFGPLDSFGGPSLASLPYFNTPYAFIDTTDVGLGYDDAEIESLVDIGASTFGNNPAGTATIQGEVVTTFLTDSGGNPDDTFKFLNYVDTASQCREFFFNNLRARFGQSRLKEGDTRPGRNDANASVIESFVKRLFQDLQVLDLVEDGEDALIFFLENLTVTLDKQLGLVTLEMEVPIVTQLRTINATMKIAFSTTG